MIKKVCSERFRSSERYRKEAKGKVIEAMMQEPLLSITELKSKIGYSKTFLANIYTSVRRSNEWRTWCREFHEKQSGDAVEVRQ